MFDKLKLVLADPNNVTNFGTAPLKCLILKGCNWLQYVGLIQFCALRRIHSQNQ